MQGLHLSDERADRATAESALLSFTHQLSKNAGAGGITVNVIRPGLTLVDPSPHIHVDFYNAAGVSEILFWPARVLVLELALYLTQLFDSSGNVRSI